MILFTQFLGAVYGCLAILLGAFGAHALKKTFSPEQLQSFETGVKYQMYHAVLLVVLGFNFGFNSVLENSIAYCFMIGTFLFSFSIYGLCLSAAKGRKWIFLGPITPIGGVFLAVGWALLAYFFIAEFV